MTSHREAAKEVGGWELVLYSTGGGNSGSGLRGDWGLRREEAEYGRTVYFNATNSGTL